MMRRAAEDACIVNINQVLALNWARRLSHCVKVPDDLRGSQRLRDGPGLHRQGAQAQAQAPEAMLLLELPVLPPVLLVLIASTAEST
jgi:hypothetical protein